MNTYEEYLEQQMKDPEFRAQYILAKEKAKLEIFMERLKEDIQKDTDKNIILKRLNSISKHIRHIAL